jgi:hypothetical protein
LFCPPCAGHVDGGRKDRVTHHFRVHDVTVEPLGLDGAEFLDGVVEGTRKTESSRTSEA